MFKLIFSFFLCFTFLACSSNALNPLGRSVGDMYDSDPLNIGDEPIQLSDKDKFVLSEGADFSKLIPLYPPIVKTNPSNDNSKPAPILTKEGKFNDVRVFEAKEVGSDFVTIMNPAGTILNIRYARAGNWIWGYTLLNSKGFKNTRVWQLIEFPRNVVMIKNEQIGTCLNAYRSGIVHYPCDPSNQSQFWELIPMSNQAVQIKNLATQKCIQSPIIDPLRQFDQISPINMVDCVKPGEMNLDQQWYITTPPFSALPVYKKGEI